MELRFSTMARLTARESTDSERATREETQVGTTLVVGGTGKTGRRVAQRLQARGVPIRLGTPSGEPPFDWDDQATWAPALRNIQSVYLTYYPDLAFPGAAEAVGEFAEVAVATGARRLVLLSGRGEDGALCGEQAVRDAGADWTIVRSAFMAQNFSEGFFLDQVLAGEVAFPAGDGLAEPFIDADDIADVAVAALTDDRHIGQLYEVTGPRLLTWADAVAEIAQATGRRIGYSPVSMEAYRSLLAEYQVPDDLVKLLTDLFTEVLDGRNAYVTDGVQRALGPPPRDFADFARDAAAAGVWRGR
jgi:uncharacterized protein YbjT (DUF2867 family)